MYSENLKKIRKELDLSVVKLSEKIEVSANTISAYERGIRCPSLDFGLQLYKKLNININWFITGEGEMFNGEKSVNNDFCKEIEQIFIKVLEQRGYMKNLLALFKILPIEGY